MRQSSARRCHFNPRTPCGVRRQACGSAPNNSHFNPRTPCGVRRAKRVVVPPTIFISIHAPRAGCDAIARTPCHQLPDISIHAPRAGCDHILAHKVRHAVISIHAHRAGCDDRFVMILADARQISIHAHRAGCDDRRPKKADPGSAISIHAHRAGCDGKFDDFNPLNLHKRYKRVLDRPKSTSEQGKNKAKLAYIHVFTVLGGCEGAGTVCALLLRTQYC